MTHRPDSAALVASALLPVLGVVFLGWDVSPAVFMIWLDTFLSNLQFSSTIFASRRAVPMTFDGPHAAAERVGASIGKNIVGVAFLSVSRDRRCLRRVRRAARELDRTRQNQTRRAGLAAAAMMNESTTFSKNTRLAALTPAAELPGPTNGPMDGLAAA